MTISMRSPEQSRPPPVLASLVAVAAMLCISACAFSAESVRLPGIDIRIQSAPASAQELSTALRVLAVLTVLSLAPAILVVMTAFTRIIVVLSMLRHAFGMQDTVSVVAFSPCR